jgi:hypothetical protein
MVFLAPKVTMDPSPLFSRDAALDLQTTTGVFQDHGLPTSHGVGRFVISMCHSPQATWLLRRDTPVKQITRQSVIFSARCDALMRRTDATAAQHRPVDAVSDEQPWPNPRDRVLRPHLRLHE